MHYATCDMSYTCYLFDYTYKTRLTTRYVADRTLTYYETA